MKPTRRDFLTTATGTVVGAAATAALTHVVTAHAHAHEHEHEHEHDGDSGPVPSEFVLRVKALESLLVEKGLVESSALDHFVDRFQNNIGPRQGARVVARAWVDPEFKKRLLADAQAAAVELGYEKGEEHLVAVENTKAQHNLIVCTLCSCYPTNLLGIQPPWYTSYAYRSRAVVDPRGLLREFGLTLPDDVDVRVWDSTAELRYMVLPERPAGTEGLDEKALAALVTRDTLIGVAKVEVDDEPRAMNGVYDMGGLDGMGKLTYKPGEAYSAFVHPAEARLRAIKHELEKEKRWNTNAFRHYQQRLPAADYLRMRYYEHWLVAIVDLLVDVKLATREEVDDVAATGAPQRHKRRGRARHDGDAARGRADAEDEDEDDDGGGPPAQFAVGDTVRSRSSDASTFTRQPRYTRGHVGVVERVHPAIGVPTARLRGRPQEFSHVYSVRFSARDLWGERANPRDSVFVDLWENYLERA